MAETRKEPPSEYWLDGLERKSLLEKAREIASAQRQDIDSRLSLAEFRLAAANLPRSLHDLLTRFQGSSGMTASAVLRELPIQAESLPETPTESGSAQWTRTVPAMLLMLVASQLGEAVSYREEKGGALVQNVVPVSGEEKTQGNVGSSTLALHTEYPFYDFCPDFILLLCLRPDRAGHGRLLIASARKACHLLDSSTIRDLFRPDFESAPPVSFRDHSKKLRHGIFSGHPDAPFLRVDMSATQALTTRAEVALSRLRLAMNQAADSVDLAAGDLVLIDNRVAAHGRMGFAPRYDGRDRWLERVFVTLNQHQGSTGHVTESNAK